MKSLTIACLCLMNSGCVIAPRRDFEFIKKAERSLGYIEGLSQCGEILLNKETRDEMVRKPQLDRLLRMEP